MSRKKIWFGFLVSLFLMIAPVLWGIHTRFDWTLAVVSVLSSLVMSAFLDGLIEGEVK